MAQKLGAAKRITDGEFDRLSGLIIEKNLDLLKRLAEV
jgi:hypothetical protein